MAAILASEPFSPALASCAIKKVTLFLHNTVHSCILTSMQLRSHRCKEHTSYSRLSVQREKFYTETQDCVVLDTMRQQNFNLDVLTRIFPCALLCTITMYYESLNFLNLNLSRLPSYCNTSIVTGNSSLQSALTPI